MTRTVINPTVRPVRRAADRGGVVPFEWDTVRPVGPGEAWTVFCAALVVGFFATLVSLSKGYLLLYGDAVAHLAIARRILDANWPGMGQLGGVWLPLPHVLMMPFVQKMAWWQSGLGGAPMSVISFAAATAGMWKLARRLVPARWAMVAVLFFALNANLLYLASTAMTEALFLALLVWSAVACVEVCAALRAEATKRASRWMLGAGVLVLAMVFTRYDGWAVGAVLWAGLMVAGMRKRLPAWVLVTFTLLCAAGPLLWFGYNAHFEGDWLDFVRGPYSAAAIERRTAPVGQHYRGWHSVGWAALFYVRTAMADSAWGFAGWVVAVLAVAGVWVLWPGNVGNLRRFSSEDDRGKQATAGRKDRGLSAANQERGFSRDDGSVGRRAFGGAGSGALLLWVPLPFYIYSVAYGSVPIFIPQLWPHSFYNTRYGIEMLPAFALHAAVALAAVGRFLSARSEAWARIAAHFFQPAMVLLCVGNLIAMMYGVPLILKEGMVNATTRVAFEHEIAAALQTMPADARVMMYTSAHVGAVQVAGRTLRSMVSEIDDDAWQKALREPAQNADFVIAIEGDPVDAAVKAHPGGLTELEVVCTTGQPCARMYRTDASAASPYKR